MNDRPTTRFARKPPEGDCVNAAWSVAETETLPSGRAGALGFTATIEPPGRTAEFVPPRLSSLMCGIAGIFDSKLSAEERVAAVAKMGEAIRHRGPDEDGSFDWPGLGASLTCRRLSIVDVADGHQPMSNEDGTVHVVFNGEIYNHPELREDLRKRGHRFQTRCDTEVIAHLYEELGVDCLDKLHGMFAVAILDVRARRLLLGRDGAGMKYLYWAQTPSGFVFGSEVKALLASGLVEAQPDWTALANFLTAGYIPSPRSGFAGVEKLPAGGWMTVEPGQIRRGKFWQLRFRHDLPRRSEQDYAEELEHLLESAVRSHLAADVPVGAFVSGGWDSSLTATLAARQAGVRLKTFSITFPNDPEVDEARFSRQVAERLGTEHHEVEFDAAAAPDQMPKVMRALEEPYIRSPALLQYQLAEMTAREVKTVISGEGADELFAGYEWLCHPYTRLAYPLRYLTPRPLARMLSTRVPALRWQMLLRVLGAKDPPSADIEWFQPLSPSIRDEVLQGELHDAEPDLASLQVAPETLASCRGGLQRRLALEFTHRLADGIMLDRDKIDMAHGLEARIPFLDRPLVDFALRLPSNLKLRGRQEKYILKLLTHVLPPEVAQRRKFGFQFPRALNQHPAMRKFAKEVLLDSPGELFQRQRLERYLRPETKSSRREMNVPWVLLVLQCWWNEFMVRPALVEG